jgi:hypothetical protein
VRRDVGRAATAAQPSVQPWLMVKAGTVLEDYGIRGWSVLFIGGLPRRKSPNLLKKDGTRHLLSVRCSEGI